MSLTATYRQILLERYLKEQLEQGTLVDITSVRSQIDLLLDSKDLTKPQFVADEYKVNQGDPSSVSLFKKTMQSARDDMTALFLNLYQETQKRQTAFERWRIESDAIEKDLNLLEDEIEDLLLLTRGTDGYHAVISDIFNHAGNVDLSLTTCLLDLNAQQIELSSSAGQYSRIFLNDIRDSKDISFKVRSTAGMVTRKDLAGSKLSDIFGQDSKVWGTTLLFKRDTPVTCELLFKIGEEPLSINKISVELHDSISSGDVTITPLYSTDLRTFSQIPSRTFSARIRGKFAFTFTDIKAKWIKLILTKQGPDISTVEGVYSYLFGFKSIALFSSQYIEQDINVFDQTFISQPRYAIDYNGDVARFEKITLDVCENIEDDTDIRYFVTSSNNPDVPVSLSTKWLPISPISRVNARYPRVISVADSEIIDIGDTEDVGISYTSEQNASDPAFVNPSESFHLLSLDSSGNLQDDIIATSTPSSIRYKIQNKNDRLLNYQIKTTSYIGSGGSVPIDVNIETLEILRNIGEKGLLSSNTNSLVRDTVRGWSFEDPYYVSIIEISGTQGLAINLGSTTILIDGVSYSGQVPASVLYGKTQKFDGRHEIKIHKKDWIDVAPGATTIIDLKSIDRMYPYNPRLLIEGYSYGSSFNEDMIYKGADLFYELKMKKISTLDFFKNISDTDKGFFSIDYDAPNTHVGGNQSTMVFLIKTDSSISDYQNERFMIRFKQLNQLHSYLRFRADLKTTRSSVTPTLQGYKLKLG